MKVYSIVVTYNGAEWVKRCFESLTNSTTLNQKIIAIDNCSSDNTVDIIRKNFSQVEVIESEQNLGFGKANNIGIKKAIEDGADYIFLLNQDAWIWPETIENLIRLQRKNPDFGVLSPIHLNTEGTLEKNFFRYIKDNYKFISISCVDKNKDQIIENIFVNAAIWLISRACLQKTGSFLPVFPHYGEDKNFIHRIHYHGFKLGVHLNSFAVHARDQKFVSKFDQNKIKLYKRIKITYLGVLLNINKNKSKVIWELFHEFNNMLKNCIVRKRVMGVLFVFYHFLILPVYYFQYKSMRQLTKKQKAIFW